jgi:hypothetical protein
MVVLGLVGALVLAGLGAWRLYLVCALLDPCETLPVQGMLNGLAAQEMERRLLGLSFLSFRNPKMDRPLRTRPPELEGRVTQLTGDHYKEEGALPDSLLDLGTAFQQVPLHR